MLHTHLSIYKQGYKLLSLDVDAQINMPRAYRPSLGVKIHNECVDILTLIGKANASRGIDRANHILKVLEHLEVVTLHLRLSHDKKLISRKLWASAIELMEGIGNQAGGWLKKSRIASAS